MSSNCTYTSILAKEIIDQCQFVRDNCEYEYVDYYSMHFCLFNSNYFLTIPIAFVFLALFFLVISGVSNSFLSPSLTKIVDTFKISQNLAGVTLIALGNGAGDVISSIVASSGGDGIELALGGLLGSGMLLTSFILGIIVYYGKIIKVNKPMFNRDIFLFIVALLILVAFSINKRIILLESFGFIGLYLLNIGIAFFQDWQNKKRIELEGIEKMNFSGRINLFNNGSKSDDNYKSSVSNSNPESNFNNVNNNLKLIDDTNDTSTFASSSNNKNVMDLSKDKNNQEKENKLISDENMETVISEIYNYNNKKTCCPMCDNNYQMMISHLKQHYLSYNDKEWMDANCLSKFVYIVIKCPINVVCSLTIPSCEEKHWKKPKYVFMPISISFFFFIAFKVYRNYSDNLSLLFIEIAIAALLSAVCCLLPNKFPETKAILLSVLSMIMSLIWIWFIANNLISLLKMIGMLFNLPDAFLGITMLALGNCVCDLSLNITLVKGGYGEMAVTTAIAGPLLNLLIGLGISLVKTNILYGDIPFNVYRKESLITAVAVVFLFVNLVRLAIQGRCLHYNLNRDISYVGFALYLIFFIIVCIITFI